VVLFALKVGNMKNIMIVILLLIIVAGGAYYLGKMQQKPEQVLKATSSPEPTVLNMITSAPSSTAVPQASPTASLNWKIYTNNKSGFSIKYPTTLNLTDSEFTTWFTFEPYPTGEVQPPLETIMISYMKELAAFKPLFDAKTDDDVIAAHNAIDVKVTKIKNLKFGSYDAVEYIRDGITPPKSGLGRGPIGYEHNFVVKKGNTEFIRFTNTTMEVEKTKQRDAIFNEMMSSLQFK
jgi:hypothetical protein